MAPNSKYHSVWASKFAYERRGLMPSFVTDYHIAYRQINTRTCGSLAFGKGHANPIDTGADGVEFVHPFGNAEVNAYRRGNVEIYKYHGGKMRVVKSIKSTPIVAGSGPYLVDERGRVRVYEYDGTVTRVP